MRRLLATLLLALAPLALLPGVGRAGEHFDFFIDLDGVILLNPTNFRGSDSTRRTITSYGTTYRLADGTEEFIQSLLEIPGARVSFFSAYDRLRTEDVARQIRLPNGLTVYDAFQGRVFSGESLSFRNANGQMEQIRDQRIGSLHAYKFLNNVLPDLDLSRSVLFDDNRGNVAPGQENNFVHTFAGEQLSADTHVEYQSSLHEFPEEAVGIAQDFVSGRNILAWARGLVEVARETAAQTGESVPAVLARLQQREGSDLRVSPQARQNPEYYRRGARIFRAMNPAYHFTSLIPHTVNGERFCPKLSQVLEQLRRQPTGQ